MKLCKLTIRQRKRIAKSLFKLLFSKKYVWCKRRAEVPCPSSCRAQARSGLETLFTQNVVMKIVPWKQIPDQHPDLHFYGSSQTYTLPCLLVYPVVRVLTARANTREKACDTHRCSINTPELRIFRLRCTYGKRSMLQSYLSKIHTTSQEILNANCHFLCCSQRLHD